MIQTILCNIIKEKGLRKSYVANKAGYSTQQFSGILNGRRKVTYDDIIRISKVLNVTPNDLFGIQTTTNKKTQS